MEAEKEREREEVQLQLRSSGSLQLYHRLCSRLVWFKPGAHDGQQVALFDEKPERWLVDNG